MGILIYSQPSIFMGFTSTDSTTVDRKYLRKEKIPESSKKQSLNLPGSEHYTESMPMQ